MTWREVNDVLTSLRGYICSGTLIEPYILGVVAGNLLMSETCSSHDQCGLNLESLKKAKFTTLQSFQQPQEQ